ncbi:hypothetical protein MESS4_820026 [Mesorhizobium sp. STM 4661]|nr:hypothetical protein MESS4_820026 [Mesorhizobium sp. STM 4661]
MLPDETGFWRGMAPARASIASRSVVLPLAKGPTMAMHFGPVRRPPARVPMTDLHSGVSLGAAAGLSTVAGGALVHHLPESIVPRVSREGKGFEGEVKSQPRTQGGHSPVLRCSAGPASA